MIILVTLLVFVLIIMSGVLIYLVTIMQDIRDIVDIIANPFLYSDDSIVFDQLTDKRKITRKNNAKQALRGNHV